MDKIKSYVLNQLDELTFWVGVFGLVVWFLLPKSWLLLFFMVLVFLPDIQFTQLIKKGSKAVRDAVDDDHA